MAAAELTNIDVAHHVIAVLGPKSPSLGAVERAAYTAALETVEAFMDLRKPARDLDPPPKTVLTHGDPNTPEDCGRPVYVGDDLRYTCPIHGLLALEDSHLWQSLLSPTGGLRR